MALLSDPDTLRFVAFPFEVSPITSAEGQSKTLADSAARHIQAITNIFRGHVDDNDGGNEDEKDDFSSHVAYWQVFAGDGPYAKDEKIKSRFVKYCAD
eukprot:1101643_1